MHGCVGDCVEEGVRNAREKWWVNIRARAHMHSQTQGTCPRDNCGMLTGRVAHNYGVQCH